MRRDVRELKDSRGRIPGAALDQLSQRGKSGEVAAFEDVYSLYGKKIFNSRLPDDWIADRYRRPDPGDICLGVYQDPNAEGNPRVSDLALTNRPEEGLSEAPIEASASRFHRCRGRNGAVRFAEAGNTAQGPSGVP